MVEEALFTIFLILLILFLLQRQHSTPSESVKGNDAANAEFQSYRPAHYGQWRMLKRANDLHRLVSGRRSCRQFSSQAISHSVIRRVMETAITAPSGANKQPWTFVIVYNAAIKHQLRLIIEAEEKLNYERRMSDSWLNDLEPFRTTWEKPYLDEAPCLIVVMKQSHALDASGNKCGEHYYVDISVSIAVGILLIALHNVGLVTVTSTPMNAGPAIRQLLQRPKNEKVLLLLPVGYPACNAQVPLIYKKTFEECAEVFA